MFRYKLKKALTGKSAGEYGKITTRYPQDSSTMVGTRHTPADYLPGETHPLKPIRDKIRDLYPDLKPEQSEYLDKIMKNYTQALGKLYQESLNRFYRKFRVWKDEIKKVYIEEGEEAAKKHIAGKLENWKPVFGGVIEGIVEKMHTKSYWDKYLSKLNSSLKQLKKSDLSDDTHIKINEIIDLLSYSGESLYNEYMGKYYSLEEFSSIFTETENPNTSFEKFLSVIGVIS